jgi:hypothetical protein
MIFVRRTHGLRLIELGDCLSSVENVTEKAQSRLDEILTEAA